MESKRLTIALAGNPNSGKTTIFNNLTGTRQKVGNWPGVTVEKKEGVINRFGYQLRIVDLPGTYSLTPFSIEEIVARNFVLEEAPDLVIDIIDASNLERSLYLATQIRELDCRVLFALNMADLARERGIRIDADKLSELLNVSVVFTVGNKNQGIDELLKKAIEVAESEAPPYPRRRVKYNKDIEQSIDALKEAIEREIGSEFPYNRRWTAVKLLENDKIVTEKLLAYAPDTSSKILKESETQRRKLAELFNDDPEIILTDERYGFIEGIIREVQTQSVKRRVDISRNIDLVLTNRFLGFPIFIFFIWAMFQVTFSLGQYPVDAIDYLVYLFSGFLQNILPAGLFKDLIVNGIVAGIGSIIVYLPNILLLFFFIAIFEDTGYMARAAFLMDRIMHLIGLHGKSFIPMLMGFGCNVPAIMATRTLESEKDRKLTILITPFMSCSAKLPVYIILAGAFFGAKAGTVIFMLYLLGIVLSIVVGRIFRSTLFRGEDAPFVMELPPYRVPMIKSLVIHMWDRSKMFLKKMGGVIFIGSVVVWVLSTFPMNVSYSRNYDQMIKNVKQRYENQLHSASADERSGVLSELKEQVRQIQREKEAEKAEKSYLGIIGKHLEPVFEPIGIDWRGSIALLTGFFAKEIVVSTMGILHAADEEGTGEELENSLAESGMTALSALSMMIFVLLYMPCLATVGVISRETGSARWAVFSIVYSTCLAWVFAFIVYNSAQLFIS